MRGCGYWLLAAGCFWGCVNPKDVRYISPTFAAQAPVHVAVLPFDNQSVDLVGPELLRRLMAEEVKKRGYDAASQENVDAGLKTLGITDGGQLRAVTPAQVGKAVGVDGLFYGIVEQYNFIDIGFVIRRIVRLNLKFLTESGTRLWEDTGEGLSVFLAFDKKEAERAFVVGLGQRELENILKTPLMREAQEAVWRLAASLPPPEVSAPPGSPPAPPPPPVQPPVLAPGEPAAIHGIIKFNREGK